jgi:hypothetical protein
MFRKHRSPSNPWFAKLREFVRMDEEERGQPRDLDEAQILSWADAHKARTGKWPTAKAGPIPESAGESWMAVEAALWLGTRGFPGRSTLPRLLAEHRGRRHRQQLPQLTIKQILAWADAYFDLHGTWPKPHSGDIPGESTNWNIVQDALRKGKFGLSGNSSLPKLLAAKRNVPHRLQQPRLTLKQILIWADRHFQRTGSWPNLWSGLVPRTKGESWMKINDALRSGSRGLKGGSTVAQLLSIRRGVRNIQRLPNLTEDQILAWSDAHHNRTGVWPTKATGPVRGARGETWSAVDAALYLGNRGLPGGITLVQLLCKKRGVRNVKHPPPLVESEILDWADAFHRRTGRWPSRHSGPIREASGETWMAVQKALYAGQRGFPGGSSLARFLAENRGVRNVGDLPRLTLSRIREWILAHWRRTGQWPTWHSGSIVDAPGETWPVIFHAALKGRRGLPVGTLLSEIVSEIRMKQNRE